MPSDAAYLSRLQATIASLRYWVPAISHAAQIEVGEADGIWRMQVRPHLYDACAFTLALTRRQSYSLTIGGRTYPDLAVDTLDLFPLLVEAIADGRVIERRWSSPNTGVETQVETIIDLGAGRTWRAINRFAALAGLIAIEDCIWRPRYFLPYERR